MRACQACGTASGETASFCAQCGHRLETSAPVEPPAPAGADAAFRRSERKLVTVLFADVKGSLALVAGHDPELAGDILAAVASCMTEAVRRHGGLVNQVLGDGVMALFGAPRAIEDHALQACLAALAMRVMVRTQVRPPVQVRVGLGSGEVVVRAVPGDVGLHYSAAGEPVHLASRMEQFADPDQVLLTEATRLLAAGSIEVRRVEGVTVKGLEDAPVWELLGMSPGRRATAVPSRRLVGRDREMGLLRHARDRAAAGDGRGVRLLGDAGSGKSRLVAEFARAHLTDGWQVAQAEAVPHRRTSYGAMGDLLGGLFALAPDDDASARREKAAAALNLPRNEQEAALAPLSHVLGLQVELPGWSGLDAWERRERTIAGAVGAVQRVAERRPVALLVEDAHWLDEESATSIRRLGATAAGRRLLSVVTSRAGQNETDAEQRAWAEARWQDHAVGPLDGVGIAAFLRSRLVPGPDVAALERKLIEHTRGNPLFLEECLQALVESGGLVREGDQLRATGPIQALRVPASLRGLLDARVDRLPEDEKDVLQAAAVVGSAVPFDLLRRVAPVDDPGLRRALARLVEAGFLIETAGGEDGRFAFRHGLIREAAYSGMLRRNLVRMHGVVLDALEQRPGPRDQVVDLLANHAMQAEAWDAASGYAQQAAVRAYDRYANPKAVHYYQQALLAAGHLVEGADRDRLTLGLHLGARWPLFRLGNVAALGPHLDAAVRLAATQPDHEGLAQAHIMRSHVRWLAGDPAAALDDAAAATRLAQAHGDADLVVRARFQRGLVAMSRGDVVDTLSDMGAVIDHMGPAPQAGRYGLDAHLVVNALGYAARAHAAAGNPVAARAHCDRALAMAAPLEQRATKIYAHLADGVVALAEGKADRAVAAARQADELCRGADMRLLNPAAAQVLAQAHLAAGAPDTALPIVRQAIEDAERMGFRAMQPQRLAVLADVLLTLGRLAEAEQATRQAITLADQVDEPIAAALSRRVLGDVLAQQGRRSEAASVLEAGLDAAAARGLAPLEAALRRRLEALRCPVDEA